jgi:hypothetical protein
MRVAGASGGVKRGGGDDRVLAGLPDDLVGLEEECRGDREAERLGGLEIDDQLEFRGLLDGQVPGLGAL